MNILTKLERKFGKYSIPNLTSFLIIGFVIGIIIEIVEPSMISMLSLDPAKIFQGQVWRLISWVLVPPSGVSIFVILTLMFYWFVGNTLEKVWGEFQYNLYIFSGIFFTDLGMIVTYLIVLGMGRADLAAVFSYFGVGVSTYYLCMSMFLAYAVLFAEQEIITLFIFIPIRMKVKWIGYLDLAYLIYQVVAYALSGYFPGAVAVIMSVLNFVIFYTSLKGRVKKIHKKRKRNFSKNVRQTQIITRHKCAICGRTEEDDSTLEFRFCSRCKGNYEYCNHHLYNHTHKK